MVSIANRKHELLDGPLLKIERAKHHVKDLQRQTEAYLSKGTIELWISQSKNPPQRTVYAKASPAIPSDFALIVGDAVNNIRTALDHICFSMVESKTDPKDHRMIGFPFAKDADNLKSAIKTRRMNIAPKNVIDEFHLLKPYPDGDKYLSAVQAISNCDKHIMIVPAFTGLQLPFIRLKELLPAAGPPSRPVADSDIVQTVGDFCQPLDPSAPIEVFDRKADFQPTALIGFGQGQPLSNEVLTDALIEMVISAENAVRRLARAYFL